MTTDEKIYVAGPICFFPRGGEIWQSRRREAQYYGFTVTLPNDNKRPPAQSKEHGAYLTLKNCRDSINLSTGIIADLENFRGSEPDGGTVYEIGMAYGHDCRCYAFTRDKRPMGVKYNSGTYTDGGILDFRGRKLPHIELPFGVCVLGACKVIEGNFSDALHAYMYDLEEESKKKAMRGYSLTKDSPKQTIPRGTRPIVYVSDIFRYEEDAAAKYAEMKKVLEENGFEAIVPTDAAPGVPVLEDTGDMLEMVYNQFDHYQQHVRNCDIILANLTDYEGFEPSSDVAFECGMADQLGKKLFAWMEDGRNMIDRIPSHENNQGRMLDANGYSVENNNAPINLMFGASFKIFDGGFENAVEKMKEILQEV